MNGSFGLTASNEHMQCPLSVAVSCLLLRHRINIVNGITQTRPKKNNDEQTELPDSDL